MASRRSEGLGFFDRLVILVAWLASCAVVFIIGYYVGKDAVPPSAAIMPGGIQVPVAGVPMATEPDADAGTFYESLGRQAGGPTTTIGARHVTTTVAVRETPPARRTTSTVPAVRSTTTHPPRVVATTIPVPTTLPPRRVPTTRPAAQVPRGQGWVLYVSPTRDRFEAERQRSALHAAGYDSRVVRMERDGDVWYRVRAGRYATEAAAEQARREVRERGIGRAFVQSE